MSTAPHHVALVSYHFDNVTAAGQSTAKMARALADHGHRVTVFTSCENWLEGETVEPTEGRLAGLTIHRVAPEPAATPGWWRALDRRDGEGWLWGRLAAVPNLLHGCAIGEWAWVLAVERRFETARETAEPPFDLLLTRLNHFTAHLVGLRLERRRPDLPWCAYFSDPWPFHLYPPPYASTVGPVQKRRLERLLERILTRAGSTLFPSTQLRDYLLAGRRARFRGRAVVAPHLENLWQKPAPLPGGEMLRLRHAGFLMKERRPEPIYAAVRALRETRPELAAKLRIEFAGRYPGGEKPRPPEDLEEMIVFHPFRSAEETWEWLMGAHVLLLIEADLELGIFFPSKLAEYLGAERPILALSPARGVSADVLAAGGGLRVSPGDAPAIARALEELLERFESGRLDELRPTPEQVARVSPENVVARYREAFALAAENLS